MFALKNIKWEFFGLLILACFPVLPFFLVSVAIALYLLFSLLTKYIQKPKTSKSIVNSALFFIQTGFFIFLLLISSFKDGFSPTLKYLEPSISLLLFPLFWFITKTAITKAQKEKIFKVFIISSFVLGVYIIVYSCYYSIVNTASFIVLSKQIPFLSIHPHYVGLYFFMSIVLLSIENIFTHKLIKYSFLLFFVFLIFAMASRAVLLVLMLFFIVEFFRNKNSLKKKFIAFFMVVLSLTSAIYFIKPLHKKIVEISSKEQFTLPAKKWPTSTQIRVGLNYCAAPIIKENWFSGVGIIHFEEQLYNCYAKFNNTEKIKYNSHNYYSFLIGSVGVFCLILFLLMLFWHFKISIQQKNWVYLYFLILITISLLTENILSRVYGVVFMLFFMTIFVKISSKLKTKN